MHLTDQSILLELIDRKTRRILNILGQYSSHGSQLNFSLCVCGGYFENNFLISRIIIQQVYNKHFAR